MLLSHLLAGDPVPELGDDATVDLIGDAFERIATRCWFLHIWLQELRSAGHLDADGRTAVQQIVDGLAAHGDSRAVELQRAEE